MYGCGSHTVGQLMIIISLSLISLSLDTPYFLSSTVLSQPPVNFPDTLGHVEKATL